jgi:hypothetical protein
MKRLLGLALIVFGLIGVGVGLSNGSTSVLLPGVMLAIIGIIVAWYAEKQSAGQNRECRCKTGLDSKDESGSAQ